MPTWNAALFPRLSLSLELLGRRGQRSLRVSHLASPATNHLSFIARSTSSVSHQEGGLSRGIPSLLIYIYPPLLQIYRSSHLHEQTCPTLLALSKDSSRYKVSYNISPIKLSTQEEVKEYTSYQSAYITWEQLAGRGYRKHVKCSGLVDIKTIYWRAWEIPAMLTHHKSSIYKRDWRCTLHLN